MTNMKDIEIRKPYDVEIVKKGADITFANFEAESRKALEKQPEAAAMIEQQLNTIRVELYDHIVPVFEDVYRDPLFHDRTIANGEAENRIFHKYGRNTQMICNLFMRELAKVPNRI